MNTMIERFVIRHLSGSKANQTEEFDFARPQLSFGRAAGCDIQFDPEQDAIVSREHGRIVKDQADPTSFTIVDNSSRNGIFVNKIRVKESVKLHPGDEVQLGSNGPVFIFDIYPRPQDMMMATKVMEIPTTIKPTTISQVEGTQLMAAEPVKTGLGKQTVERMLASERKRSVSLMSLVIGGLVVVLSIAGYTFRDKLFATTQPTIIIKDTTQSKKRSPEQIAKENEDKVVQIEFAWQLFDVSTSDELWHEYIELKNPNGQSSFAALYIENEQGRIEPYLELKKNIRPPRIGVPIGIAGASGSGFVVSEDGFILTNRHVGTGWNTMYRFPSFAFPGALVRIVNNERQIVPNQQIRFQHVAGWVPAEAQLVGGFSKAKGTIKGRNTFMNVVFAGTALRRPVESVTPSDNHDVALIKVEMPESLQKVTLKDYYENVGSGQSITVMGYPGVAPQQFVVRRSNDPLNPYNQFNSIPTPTVTPGNIGRVIPASSDKDLTYSTVGDSYQLTVNATGAGNSGGPIFDDEGNVIGIFYAGTSDAEGTQISFAVPIKYGLELMGRKKVSGR